MTPKILLVYPNLPLMMAPAISMGIFNAICKNEGCTVEIFETTQYSDKYSNRHIRMTEIGANRPNKDDEVKDMFHIQPTSEIVPNFVTHVKQFKPDLILMGVQEDVWGMAQTLLDAIKDLNVEHILGGVFPTSAPQIVLGNPLVKRIGMHEGENIVLQAITCLKNGDSLDTVAGTWWKDKFGLVHKNPLPQLCDITKVIPDFTCFADYRWQRPMGGKIFQRAVSMETYRGCPYNCTYCNSPNTRNFSKTAGTGNFMRRKCVKTIERDLLYYKELYNPDLIMFQDDSFLARPKREIFEFCEMWSKYKIPFWFNTRIENCAPDVLAALKEAGVYRMTFGLESGNEEYRSTVLERAVTNKKYLEYFNYINASNIPYSLNVIIGMPFETREMVLETADMIRASRGYDGLTISMFQPYHGTGLRELAVKNGFLPENFINGQDSVEMGGGYLDSWALRMPQPYLQPDDVKGLTRTFALHAHFGRDHYDEIYRAETDDEVYKRLMTQYQQEFFGDIQQGGADRINSKYCAMHDASSTYKFTTV
jgi:anaerobic magnesium-protoporphyrin IX monomethyl ester cyclase